LLFVAAEDLADAIQEFAPAGGRRQAPRVERVVRGVDRRMQIIGIRFLERADEVLAVRRIAILERLAARGSDPSAVDVVLIFACGAQDRKSVVQGEDGKSDVWG